MTRGWIIVLLGVVVSALQLGACEKVREVEATQVLFAVTSELGGVVRVEARLFDPTEQVAGREQVFDRPPPLSFAVVPAPTNPLQSMLMVLTAKAADGSVLAVHKTVFSFVPYKTVLIEPRFTEACRGLTCDRGQTCVASASSAGACGATPTTTGREIPPVTEPGSEFTGVQGIAGGGLADGGGSTGSGFDPDAGGTMSGGTMSGGAMSGGAMTGGGGTPGTGPATGGGGAPDAGAGAEAGGGDVDAAPPPECDATNPCSTPGYSCEGSVCVSRCQQTACDPNATCALVNGAPACSCNSGFISMIGAGGAVTCARDVQCSELGCDTNATCEVGTDQLRRCVCKTGFTGTGKTCTPISCGALSITNGSVVTGGATFGNTATYTCDTGYTKTGGSTRKCEVSGWSGTAPTCVPFDCGSLPAPAHGKITVTNGTKYPSGSVRYSCDTNFTLSSTTDTRMCTATGWSGSAPTCRGCGDGIVDGLREQCDTAVLGQDPWTCTSTCRVTHMYTYCRSNSECDSGQGQVCYLNKCNVTNCVSAGDCPATPSGGGSPLCQGGLCFVRCSANSQCPKGLICNAQSGLCDGCFVNADCPVFQHCNLMGTDVSGYCSL